MRCLLLDHWSGLLSAYGSLGCLSNSDKCFWKHGKVWETEQFNSTIHVLGREFRTQVEWPGFTISLHGSKAWPKVRQWGNQSLSFASTQNRLENDFDHWDQWPLLVINNCHHFHHYPCFGLAGVTAVLSPKIPLTHTGPRGPLHASWSSNQHFWSNIKQIFSKLIWWKYFFPFLSSLSSLS